ncbi:MAG: hypothetical protein V1874_03700 [Spirochaetota bacterium]
MSDDRELFKNIYRVPSARLKGWDYSFPGWYYLTICTANKECLFGEIRDRKMQLNPTGEIVRLEWERSFEIRKELAPDAYIIMPDHIHAIVVIKYAKMQGRPAETQGDNRVVETHGCASLLYGNYQRKCRDVRRNPFHHLSQDLKRVQPDVLTNIAEHRGCLFGKRGFTM